MVVSPLICRGHFASALIVARHHRPGDHQPLFFSFIIKIKDKKRENEGIRYREYNRDKERRRRHRSCSHSSDKLRNRPKSLSLSRALSKSKRSSRFDMAPLAAVILLGQLHRVPSTVQEMVQNIETNVDHCTGSVCYLSSIYAIKGILTRVRFISIFQCNFKRGIGCRSTETEARCCKDATSAAEPRCKSSLSEANCNLSSKVMRLLCMTGSNRPAMSANGSVAVYLIIESLYVEIGRVALINYGKDYGKLVVIVDVLDQNMALVDAPDMVRSQMNFKRLSLTDIKIDINRVPGKKSLIEAMEKADVKNKWENSSWGKKLIVQKRRAALNDFDKFKLMLAKIKKGGLIRQELAKLKKENAA
ncbi:hypothetical protein WN943_010742 [Citrus x changshan-huyou]